MRPLFFASLALLLALAACEAPIQQDIISTPIMLYDGSMMIVPLGGRVEAGNAAIQVFQVPVHSAITGISWSVAPDRHATIAGIGLGSVQLYRIGLDAQQKLLLDAATRVGPRVTDPSPDAATYSQPHTISVTINEDASDELYVVGFSQEAGGDPAVGGAVYGTTVTLMSP